MFDELEMFIKKFYPSELKTFSFTTIADDLSFLNSDQWERFILQNLPQLEEFYFKFEAHFDDDYRPALYNGKSNPFTSSFWIERRWIMDIEVQFDTVVYSIHPYKYD